jgi:hypothetical protein
MTPATTERRRRVPRVLAVRERRLLTDKEAGDYIGASRSYVRALVANRVLQRVELPATNGDAQTARMLRFDIRDLDRFVDALKQ